MDGEEIAEEADNELISEQALENDDPEMAL